MEYSRVLMTPRTVVLVQTTVEAALIFSSNQHGSDTESTQHLKSLSAISRNCFERNYTEDGNWLSYLITPWPRKCECVALYASAVTVGMSCQYVKVVTFTFKFIFLDISCEIS